MHIKRLHQNAKITKKSVPGSAGYDLYCIENILIPPGTTTVVPLGIALHIPDGYFGKMYNRSRISLFKDIHIFAGVIDSQFHGEKKLIMKRQPKLLWSFLQKTGINSICKFFSLTPYGEVKNQIGKRVAQMVFHKFQTKRLN